MKLPEHIPIELTPRTNAAWSRVQALSQNPRLLLQVKPDRTLTSVIDFLTKKWRSESLVLVPFKSINNIKKFSFIYCILSCLCFSS